MFSSFCGKGGNQTACKPGSVTPTKVDATIIPLDRPLLDGSRDLPGHLGPSTVLPSCEGAVSLFGLAPGGACHAVPVAGSAVRSYRTLSPLPEPRFRRSTLCGAIPRVTPGGRYPPPCRSGARTFLDPRKRTAIARPSGSNRHMAAMTPRVNRPDAHRSVGPNIAPSSRRDLGGSLQGRTRDAPAIGRTGDCQPSPWLPADAGRGSQSQKP